MISNPSPTSTRKETFRAIGNFLYCWFMFWWFAFLVGYFIANRQIYFAAIHGIVSEFISSESESESEAETEAAKDPEPDEKSEPETEDTPCPLEADADSSNHHFSLLTLTARKYGIDEENVDLSQFEAVLQRMADSQLHLFEGLEPVPVHIEPALMALGSFAAPIAGKVHVEDGLTEPDPERYPHILIQQDLVLHASVFEVYQVLLHELTHAWVHDGPGAVACYAEDGGIPRHGGHCTLFLEKAMELDLETSQTVNICSAIFWNWARLRIARTASRLSTLEFRSLVREAYTLITGDQEADTPLRQLQDWPHFPREFLQWL